MPIINEIDEENPKNNRTIDTETGVYLQHIDENLYEGIVIFHYMEKDSKILINTYFSNKINEEKKINDCTYYVNSCEFFGAATRKNYSKIIRDLLEVHGVYYRRREKFENLKQEVRVEFTEKAIASLDQGEKAND